MPKLMDVGEVYSVDEVLELFGIKRGSFDAWKVIKNGEFPFPVVKMGIRFLVPKKPVDAFLAGGKKLRIGMPKLGRPKKIIDGPHYNFAVPQDLHDRFCQVHEGINKMLPTPIGRDDLRRLAIEEFIQRRPEFITDDED